MTLSRGQRLLDRYLLEDQIGRGGMATVMRARDERTGKWVAVKQLSLVDGEDGDKQRAWFKREVKALMLLDHPGIPRLLDHGALDDETPYLVSEYLQGIDLDAAVERHGALPEGVIMKVAAQLLEALDAAHELDIVHRDIKPANVFLCHSGRAVLLDFGLARAASLAAGQTMAGGNATALAGTPQYFSPEQIRNEVISVQSDLFSLGATLYHLGAGRPPFVGHSVLDVITAIRENERRPLASSAHWLRRETCAFIEHLLQPALDARPKSARAASEEAARVLRGLPDADALLRQYTDAIKRGVRPPAPTVAGTIELTPLARPDTPDTTVAPAPVSETAVTPAPVSETVVAPAPMREPVSTPAAAPRKRFPAVAALLGVLAIVAVALAWSHPWTQPRAALPPEPAATQPVNAPPTPATLPEPLPAPAQRAEPPPREEPEPKHTEPKRAIGTVSLQLRQWAVVAIDGKSYGRKQLAASFDLPEGAHQLELTNDRYGTRRARVVVKRNQETTVEVDFVKGLP